MKPINITFIRISMMRRNCLEFDFGFNSGEQLIINRNKIDWETLNTSEIKLVFFTSRHESHHENDYGARIRFKCHKPIQRKAKTLEAELCTNWDFIDSFGVRLDFDDSIYHTDGYKKFYDDPPESWSDNSGEELYKIFIFARTSRRTVHKA